VAAQTLPDFVSPPQRPVSPILPLAFKCQPITVAAEEVISSAVENCNPTLARDAVYHTWTNEPRAPATVVAGRPSESYRFFHVFPFLPWLAASIGQYHQV
jgi:hypothetical protein